MSRLETPLAYRTLASTGDVLLRAELDLAVKTAQGGWEVLTFRVDSATEMTTMPAAEAKAFGLPYPKQPVLGLTMRGLDVRAGYLRARIVGMDKTEYFFPCYFLGDPDSPAGSSLAATSPRNLLGLTGVIDKLRLLFDGSPVPGAPHGLLIVEKK